MCLLCSKRHQDQTAEFPSRDQPGNDQSGQMAEEQCRSRLHTFLFALARVAVPDEGYQEKRLFGKTSANSAGRAWSLYWEITSERDSLRGGVVWGSGRRTN